MNNIIYGLCDPIDGILHYIGYTSDPKERFRKHCRCKEGTKEKRIWIQHLKKSGLKPIMFVIEEYATPEHLPLAEEHWYWFWKFFGAQLYNDPYCIGGAFKKGHKHSDETKAKMSATRKNISTETRAKLSIAMKGNTHGKGYKHSDEAKAKISIASKNVSVETRAKRNASNKGKKRSDEIKAKMSAAQKGRKHSPETKAKLSAAKRNISDETRTKLSNAHKGKVLSAETKIKMSAAKKGKPPNNKGKRYRIKG